MYIKVNRYNKYVLRLNKLIMAKETKRHSYPLLSLQKKLIKKNYVL